MKVLVLVLVLVLGLAGCSNNPQEDMFESKVNTLKSKTTSITTAYETEVETEMTAEPIIIDGEKFYDGMELVHSYNKGMQIKIVAYQAARAYLRGDMNELEKYLVMPSPDYNYRDEENIYDTLDYLSLTHATILSETEVHLGHLMYRDLATDYYTYYLYINLIKTEDEWKVSQIWIEI